MTENNGLIEIRWHGRGGQGAVTSTELLAQAAISEGKYAQAFPSFGPERRGAPVQAFNRIDTRGPVRVRADVTEPDVVVVLDPSLLEARYLLGNARLRAGLLEEGFADLAAYVLAARDLPPEQERVARAESLIQRYATGPI